MSAEYFSYLTKSVGRMLGEVIKEDGLGLFRKSPQVLVGTALSEMSTDYHLFFLGKEFLETDSGTFTAPTSAGSFLVFRNPVRTCVSYLILGNGLLAQNKLRTYDKLMGHFFDNARVDPFLPDSYKQYPALYERLAQTKAEVKVRGDLSLGSQQLPSAPNTFDGFRMVLDYTAQYHSGTLLREENRVKTRVIEYSNNVNERSV